MKSIVVLSCILAVALSATVEYEDIEEIIKNDRLFDAYAACFLDKGKCTPQAKNIKGNLQNGLETGCTDCTEKQKTDVATITKYVIDKKPDIWNELCAKYDASGKYRKKYEEEAKKRGVVY